MDSERFFLGPLICFTGRTGAIVASFACAGRVLVATLAKSMGNPEFSTLLASVVTERSSFRRERLAGTRFIDFESNAAARRELFVGCEAQRSVLPAGFGGSVLIADVEQALHRAWLEDQRRGFFGHVARHGGQ